MSLIESIVVVISICVAVIVAIATTRQIYIEYRFHKDWFDKHLPKKEDES